MSALPQAVFDDLPHLALVGRMGAGKTTAAEILQEHYGYTAANFNTGIHAVAQLLWPKPTRDQLIQVGRKMREIDDDVWLNRCLRVMDGPSAYEFIDADDRARRGIDVKPRRFTNDSCRFPNEYWALKERGFVFVKVGAPEEIRVDRLQRIGKLDDVSQLEDPSETALDRLVVDYHVPNNRSVEKLKWHLDAVLQREAARA